MPRETWRVPVRVDFAGGTLDLWPIYAMMGGCVTVNAAVDLWVEIGLTRSGQVHRLTSRDLGLDLGFEAWPTESPATLSWVWRVLDASGAPPAMLTLHSPVPQGSGLGVSSCLGVGLLGVALELEAGEARLVRSLRRLRPLLAADADRDRRLPARARLPAGGRGHRCDMS